MDEWTEKRLDGQMHEWMDGWMKQEKMRRIR